MKYDGPYLQLLILSSNVAVLCHVLLHQLHQFLVIQCLQLVFVYPEGALARHQAWCCVRMHVMNQFFY